MTGNYAPTDEIDSTFQRVENPDMPEWEGTHTFGDYSATRRILLSMEAMELVAILKYEYDGEELNRVELAWDVTEKNDADEFVDEVERYIVDHSGETATEFAESAHFADPQADIEGARRER